MDPLTGYCFGGIMLNVDDDITTRFPWRRGHAGREIPAERARARDRLCLILGFGIPLIPLVGVDSAEGTEVSAASDVATVSAENSLQNGSFEQPDVYQYRETSDVPYWKSTTTSGSIEIGSVFKNGNGDNDSLRMRTGEKSGRGRRQPIRQAGHVERQLFDLPAARHHTRREMPMVPEAQGASVRFEERFRYTRGHHRGHAWRRTAIVLMGWRHRPVPQHVRVDGNGWDSPGWTFPDSSVFNQYTRNGWNEYEGEFAADGDDTVFALASTTRSTATSHTAISWTTCPLPRKAATAATS